MNATEIRRITADDLEHPKSMRADLAMEASRKLGYNKMSLGLTTKAPLMDVLIELDILPLKKSIVEKYKKSKETTSMWSGHVHAIWCLLTSCVICAPIFCKLLTMAFVEPGYTFSFVATIVGTVVVGLFGIIALICGLVFAISRDERGSRTLWRWATAPLTGTSMFVPEFALRKAIQIKDAYPQATFHIEYLQPKEECTVRSAHLSWIDLLLDPFLVVSDSHESYYIDVWDEKEFEDKL